MKQLTGNMDSVYIELGKAVTDSTVFSTRSRLGPARDLGLCCITIRASDCPIVCNGNRAINPVFAIVEAAWILSGSNLLSPLARVVRTYSDYSDDGVTLHGAYGYRLRRSNGIDQIETSINLLRQDSDSRRVTLYMGEGRDLASASRDIPCNVCIMFRRRGGELDMTVINRSNDLYLGVPYDIFSFSVLHMYVALEVGIDIGSYSHISNSLHLYDRDSHRFDCIIKDAESAEVGFNKEDWTALGHAIASDFEAIIRFDTKALSCSRLQVLFEWFEMFKGGARDHLPTEREVGRLLYVLVKNWSSRFANK